MITLSSACEEFTEKAEEVIFISFLCLVPCVFISFDFSFIIMISFEAGKKGGGGRELKGGRR